MTIILDGTNGITTPMYNGSITANAVTPSVNMKNRIINGAMVFDQRNAGSSIGTASSTSTYTLDRWLAVFTQNSKFTIQQNAGSVTPPVGFTNYLGITTTTAYSDSGHIFSIGQYIEGFNTADLGFGTANAKTITVSFWVRSSLTGTFGGALQNSALNRSYPFTFTISVADTWEYKTIIVAGDTSGTWIGATNGIGLRLWINLGSGSTYSGTAGAWAGADYRSATGSVSVIGTLNATFYITGVQLEVGSTATSFDYRPYGTELALCQRYYEKSYLASVVPGTSTNVGMTATYIALASSVMGLTIKFCVTKRTTANMTFYSGNGVAGGYSNDFAGSGNAGTATASGTGDSSTAVYNSSGNAAGFVGVQWVATAEL